MSGKKGASGRKASAASKKHQVAARLSDADYESFSALRATEAGPLLARGIDCTESDFLRILIYEGAEKRGRAMGAGLASPASSPMPARGRRKPAGTS